MNFKTYLNHSGLEYKEYQNDGVNWCIEREKINAKYSSGGIIADEMGLGKTITMIGTIICNFKMPNLIIVPVALLEQWREQIRKTTGHNPIIYQGGLKKILNKEQLEKIPIVITTYGNIVSDKKKDKKLQSIMWGRIICDEAHHLRNKKTQITKSVNELKSKITWLISGTPIQNHINDLYSLFNILKIPNKIYLDTNGLQDIIKTIILKRTKKEVGINLPKLNINKKITDWKSKNEQKLSEEIHDKLKFSNLKQKMIRRELLLSILMYARMICVYPYLIKKHLTKLINDEIVSSEYKDGINDNSKIYMLIDTIIERKNNKNRKIIFANFHEEIIFIKNKLLENGFKVDYIDGTTSKNNRKEILKKELDVLILQIKTGNEGLNLQEYNEIYFITPDWNPKIEEQAIGRCYRMGQKKEVHVFKFIMNNFDNENKTKNIEMYTEDIQRSKLKIEKKILEDN
jgi:non-specific serine/threonine protein kinase